MGNLRNYEHGLPVWVDLETSAGTTAASRFYCGLFGWRVMARHRPLDDGYWVFRQDGMDVGGLAHGQQSTWRQCISTPDIDATADTVVENGGHVLLWPLQVFEAGWIAVFTDPAGAHIAAWQPAVDTGADIIGEPNSFAWSELSCNDVDAAARFYNAVFGWEAKSTPLPDGSAYTEFHLPGVERRVAGMVEASQRQPAGPPRWGIYFAVADIDATAARATELGGSVAMTPRHQPGLGRIASLRDSGGALFSLIEPE